MILLLDERCRQNCDPVQVVCVVLKGQRTFPSFLSLASQISQFPIVESESHFMRSMHVEMHQKPFVDKRIKHHVYKLKWVFFRHRIDLAGSSGVLYISFSCKIVQLDEILRNN